jgi:hypothetical protein
MYAVQPSLQQSELVSFDQWQLCRFPIVEPDYGHTKLRLSKEGLEAIQRIKTPIAAVSVCTRFRI